MARKTISASEAQRDFAKVLEDVSTRDDSFVVVSDGEPVAALVPIGVFDSVQLAKDRIIERMEAAAVRANLSPEEADRLASEAVEAVRAQHRRRR